MAEGTDITGRPELSVSIETLSTPWIGLGCASFGSTCTDRQGQSILDAAYHAGVRYLDTARPYGYGKSEQIIGAWLRRLVRSEVVVASKIGREIRSIHPARRFLRQRIGRFAKRVVRGRRPQEIQRKETIRRTLKCADAGRLRESVSRSLDALGTDYLDVLMLHSVGADAWDDDVIPALEELICQGIVRRIGLATNRTDCEQLLACGVPANVVQFPDSALWDRPIQWRPDRNVTVVTHSVLGRDGRMRQMMRDYFASNSQFRRRWNRVLGVEVASTAGVAECLLRCALARNVGGGVLCGVSRLQQVKAIRRIIDSPLEPALVHELQRTLQTCFR